MNDEELHDLVRRLEPAEAGRLCALILRSTLVNSKVGALPYFVAALDRVSFDALLRWVDHRRRIEESKNEK